MHIQMVLVIYNLSWTWAPVVSKHIWTLLLLLQRTHNSFWEIKDQCPIAAFLILLFWTCFHKLSLQTFSINESLAGWDLDYAAAKLVFRTVDLQRLVKDSLILLKCVKWLHTVGSNRDWISCPLAQEKKKKISDFIDVDLSSDTFIKEISFLCDTVYHTPILRLCSGYSWSISRFSEVHKWVFWLLIYPLRKIQVSSQ